MPVKRIEFNSEIVVPDYRIVIADTDPQIKSQVFGEIAKLPGKIEPYKPGKYDITAPEDKERGFEAQLTVFSDGTGKILRTRPNVDAIEDLVDSKHRQLLDLVLNSPDSETDFMTTIWAITLWTRESTSESQLIEAVFRYFELNETTEALEQDLVGQAVLAGCNNVSRAKNILRTMTSNGFLKKRIENQNTYYTLNIKSQNDAQLH